MVLSFIFLQKQFCVNKKANIIIIKDHKTLISFCYRKMSYFEHETILSDVSLIFIYNDF